MKNLSVEHIRNSGEFRLVKELRFNEILAFVLENIRAKNAYTVFYVLINLLFISLLSGESIYGFIKGVLTFKTYLACLGWGVLAGSILIIPFHEGIHALGFLLIGAKKIRFGADLKQMIFYATANNFVAGSKGFSFVAMAPFLTINVACLPIMLNSDPEIRLFFTIMLLLHNIMCIGDFGMLSFYRQNKDKEMFTFDDIPTKTAFFYERIKANIH
jgi:hypothetical protein